MFVPYFHHIFTKPKYPRFFSFWLYQNQSQEKNGMNHASHKSCVMIKVGSAFNNAVASMGYNDGISSLGEVARCAIPDISLESQHDVN